MKSLTTESNLHDVFLAAIVGQIITVQRRLLPTVQLKKEKMCTELQRPVVAFSIQ
jgi:hypothetical protein